MGRTVHDLFEPELAISYRAQDLAVVRSGHPVRRQLELITRPDGSLGWYVTNKTLLRDGDSQPVAIMAVSVDENIPATQPGMRGLEMAIATVHARFPEPLAVADLAASAGMSVAMLERRMKRLIGQTPRRLIVRVRVEEAVALILRGDQRLARIASECGFTDQAAMSKQVKQVLGVSPRDLRRAQRGVMRA